MAVDRTALVHVGGPAVSVVVPTVGRWSDLRRCLDGLHPQLRAEDEVVVVDNSSSPRPPAVVDDGVVVLAEPRRGASWARNAGWRAASNQLVAFLDDDTRPDRSWLDTSRACIAGADLVTGGVLGGNAGAFVAGVVDREYPLHRGWLPRRFGHGGEPLAHHGQTWQVGVGACMTWRRSLLDAIGGFDPALGNGTPAGGAEDLDAFHRAIAAGARVRYEPRALVWHRHPESFRELGETVRLYARALGGQAAKVLLEEDVRRALAAAGRQVTDGYRLALRSSAPSRDLPVTPQLMFGPDFVLGGLAFARHRRSARSGGRIAGRRVRMPASEAAWALPAEVDVATEAPDDVPVGFPTRLLLRNGDHPVGMVELHPGASASDGIAAWASFVLAAGKVAW